MNRNPIVPYAITAIIGILLMVGISFYGLDKAEKLAEGDEHGGEAAVEEVTDPEAIFQQSCAACHGQDLGGGVGPALTDVGGRLSAEEIAGVIQNGQGTMPANLVDAEKAEKLAQWLAEKK